MPNRHGRRRKLRHPTRSEGKSPQKRVFRIPGLLERVNLGPALPFPEPTQAIRYRRETLPGNAAGELSPVRGRRGLWSGPAEGARDVGLVRDPVSPRVVGTRGEAYPRAHARAGGRATAVVHDPHAPITGHQVGSVVLPGQSERLAEPPRASTQVPVGEGVLLTPGTGCSHLFGA